MDGFEATRHIRQLESQRSSSHRVPIVALTAGKTEVEKERCYASGMDRILFKPYSTTDLNSLLAQYFHSEGEMEIAHPPPVPTEPVGEILDIKALDNIRSVEAHTGNSLLCKVFDNFKIDVQSKLDELRANLDQPAVLGAGAHAIKSMSLNIGAKALAEYCRRCETDWRNQLISDAGREIEVMHGHYMDVVRALEPIVETSMDAVGS
jgi:HPt (histidine-containing phosphotransfer) domain-containing protein